MKKANPEKSAAQKECALRIFLSGELRRREKKYRAAQKVIDIFSKQRYYIYAAEKGFSARISGEKEVIGCRDRKNAGEFALSRR